MVQFVSPGYASVRMLISPPKRRVGDEDVDGDVEEDGNEDGDVEVNRDGNKLEDGRSVRTYPMIFVGKKCFFC